MDAKKMYQSRGLGVGWVLQSKRQEFTRTDLQLMPVYVDRERYPFGRMIMCHMAADTLRELHDMAHKIGIPKKWFQNKKTLPHYDVCLSMRAKAVEFGAIEVDRQRMSEIIKEWRMKSPRHGVPNENIGKCAICGNRDKQEKHHLKPKADGLAKEGPIIHVCPLCHHRMHDEIGNDVLRVLTIGDLKDVLGN